jgi:hypothetical protein
MLLLKGSRLVLHTELQKKQYRCWLAYQGWAFLPVHYVPEQLSNGLNHQQE